ALSGGTSIPGLFQQSQPQPPQTSPANVTSPIDKSQMLLSLLTGGLPPAAPTAGSAGFHGSPSAGVGPLSASSGGGGGGGGGGGIGGGFSAQASTFRRGSSDIKSPEMTGGPSREQSLLDILMGGNKLQSGGGT
ncbi:hypothetical protein HDU76_011953, partial [Blyttiomyces sp. JEL0837]